MRRTIQLAVASVATFVVVLGGVAVADAPWARVSPREDRPVELTAEARAVFAEQAQRALVPGAIAPADEVNALGAAAPEPDGPPMRSSGRLEAFDDARLLFSVPAVGDAAPAWARVVRARADVDDNTLFDDRLFVRYKVAPAAEALLARVDAGAEVDLELVRGADGEPWVVAVRLR
jgi:hypothetical protein